MDTQEVMAKLEGSRGALHRLVVNNEPGVYAFFLKQGASLKCGPVHLDGLVYVGKSADLAARQFRMHFAGNTGFSTLRRSIGALLKDTRCLRAVPRGPGNAATNYSNYKFDTEGEVRLTEWMHANLEIGVCPIPSGYEEMERALIAELKPPLCLQGWPNPHCQDVRRMRRVCADEARGQSVS